MQKLPELGKTIILSPHDDDAAIGCGSVIYDNEAVHVIILTSGDLGYHDEDEAEEIAEKRKQEAQMCYRVLGAKTHFLDFPDMSLHPYRCWKTPDGKDGAYKKVLRLLRKLQPDTLFLPNRHDRHPDHQAAFDIGRVCAFQAAQPIVPELGEPIRLKNLFSYRVWNDLAKPSHANELDTVKQAAKQKALESFESQRKVLEALHIGSDKEVFEKLYI